MSDFKPEALRDALSSGRALPREFIEALRAQERAQARRIRASNLASIGRRLNGFPRVNRVPPLGLASPRGIAPGRTPTPDALPLPLVCFPGWQPLADKSSGFVWGSDEQPRFGPACDPQPDVASRGYAPGTVCHKWSAMTQAQSGPYSLAVREESPNGPEGWEPEDLEFFGYQGTHVDATTGQVFYLPDFGQSGASVLQALTRVTADHVAPALAVYTGGDEYSFAAIFGFVTVTLSQGLFALPADRASASTEFIDYEMNHDSQWVRQVSLLDDPGYADTIATLKWDGASNLFFVDVNLSLHVVSMFDAQTPCGGFADLRFGWNDALLVSPDGISQAGNATSCPLQLSEVKLCGF